MPDYSKMTDAELQAIAGGQPAQAPAGPDFSKMTDEELMSIATGGATGSGVKMDGIGDVILGGVAKVGEFVDRFTGAPARAAITREASAFP